MHFFVGKLHISPKVCMLPNGFYNPMEGTVDLWETKRDQSEEPVSPTSINHPPPPPPAWNAINLTPSPPSSLLPVSSKNSPEPTLMPLYLPPHYPPFLPTSPHLPLPRHRSINFFIPAYQRLWIEAEEYSFEEKLVQDLAVSTGLALPLPHVPCVGTPLPVLSAECFFSTAPVEPWERIRVGTSPKAPRGGPRSKQAKPFKQRSVRGQRLHEQLRKHRASAGALVSRRAGFAFLTAAVRRAFEKESLAVWLPDLDPTHQLSFRCTL